MSACAQPLRGPFITVPNHNGSGTHSEVQSHLSAQTALAERPIQNDASAAPKAPNKKINISLRIFLIFPRRFFHLNS